MGHKSGGETVTDTHYQYNPSRKEGEKDRDYRDFWSTKEIREKRFLFTSGRSAANRL